MEYLSKHYQWGMSVAVFHAPTYGHGMELRWGSLGRQAAAKDLGHWHTLGVPEQILNEATTAVACCLSEHLVTRYGVQGELPMRWAGEPDPF